jgi:uncharacterized protein YciI
MFVLSLTYTAPIERIDALLEQHVAWLDRGYAEGMFLASGRKVPRTGGVLLAVAASRAAVEEFVAADPFAREGVADYEITEFVVTRTSPDLEQRVEQLP